MRGLKARLTVCQCTCRCGRAEGAAHTKKAAANCDWVASVQHGEGRRRAIFWWVAVNSGDLWRGMEANIFAGVHLCLVLAGGSEACWVRSRRVLIFL